MIQTRQTDRILRIPDIAAIIGRSHKTAQRLVKTLGKCGLPRKGRGRGSHWLESQFWAAYEQLDSMETDQ